jgi:hypothetical protein
MLKFITSAAQQRQNILSSTSSTFLFAGIGGGISFSSINNTITNNVNSFDISTTTTNNISGPLDQFNVTSLVGLKFEILGKFYLAITNISLYLALVLAIVIAIFYFGDNDSKLVPNK